MAARTPLPLLVALTACADTGAAPSSPVLPVECPRGTAAQCVRVDGLGPIPLMPEGTRCPGGWVPQCGLVACVTDDDCDFAHVCYRPDPARTFGLCEPAPIRLITLRPAPETR